MHHIKVVNKHWCKEQGVYIGRPSVLGNPYSHLENTKAEYKVGSRDEAVQEFEKYLRDKINKDLDITREMKRLYRQLIDTGELTLVCWCAPNSCHGDVIKRVLEEKLERENK